MAYKRYFLEEKQEDICYEYFMGEVPTKQIKYHELGKLFPFDDSFYKNLSHLLELDKNNHFIEFMLSALLYNPQELFNVLITIFNSLYKIDSIKQDNSISSNEKNELIKMQEYIFNQSTIDYLENTLMPLLQRGFAWKNELLANEAEATQQEVNEMNIDDNTSSISVNITAITPIQNDVN